MYLCISSSFTGWKRMATVKKECDPLPKLVAYALMWSFSHASHRSSHDSLSPIVVPHLWPFPFKLWSYIATYTQVIFSKHFHTWKIPKLQYRRKTWRRFKFAVLAVSQITAKFVFVNYIHLFYTTCYKYIPHETYRIIMWIGIIYCGCRLSYHTFDEWVWHCWSIWREREAHYRTS